MSRKDLAISMIILTPASNYSLVQSEYFRHSLFIVGKKDEGNGKMVKELDQKSCIPCQGGVSPLAIEEAEQLLLSTAGWELKDGAHHLQKRFEFGDFLEALAFINKVGHLAEAEGHHPDIEFGWGYAVIKIFTHKINGLHENDFILAAKINQF